MIATILVGVGVLVVFIVVLIFTIIDVNAKIDLSAPISYVQDVRTGIATDYINRIKQLETNVDMTLGSVTRYAGTIMCQGSVSDDIRRIRDCQVALLNHLGLEIVDQPPGLKCVKRRGKK